VKRIVSEEISRKEKSRKNQNEIRDRIQYELGVRPKTKHELANAIKGTSKRTVGRHLEHLEGFEIVELYEHDDGKNYWRLVM